MSTMRSQDEIRNTVVSLGLPEHPYFMRRTARAISLLDTGKVNFVGDEIFRVHSQFDDTIYHVELNHGTPKGRKCVLSSTGCTCPDHQKNPGVLCKHMIAATIYQKQAKSTVKVTWDDTENSYHKRGRWWVTDYKERIKYVIYRDGDGNLICPCGRKPDCEHRRVIREYLNNNNDGGNGNGSRDGTHCVSTSQQPQLDRGRERALSAFISDPFQESESYDIDQIEGRRNGEMAWKLSDGRYSISYQGIMTLAQRHSIEFSVSIHDDANLVIATAMNGSQRASGKEVRFCGLTTTASELAKRNAARQLLPLTEMEAIEQKVQLEAEFDWQTAYQKCIKVAGTQANVDITINELVTTGKLRQVRFSDSESGDKKSHYNRTEWLIIYNACAKDDNDDDGGEKPLSSNNADSDWKEKLRECKGIALNDIRFNWIKTDLMRENALRKAYPRYWTDQDFGILKRACALDTSLFNREIGEHWVIQKEDNFNAWDYSRRYRFWMVTKDTQELREKCFYCGKTKVQVSQLYDDIISWERYNIKTVICSDCLWLSTVKNRLSKTTKVDMTRRFDQLYHQSPNAVRTDGLPKPSETFQKDLRDKLAQVRQGGDAPYNKS